MPLWQIILGKKYKRNRKSFSLENVCMSEKLVIPKILAARFRGGYSKLEFAATDNPTDKKSNVVETADYVELPFRILSKTFIESHDLDLTKGDVLKKATPLFKTRILRDHKISLDSIVGHVLETSWSEAKGDIPAGVDGTYRIFKKFSGDICDKLLTNPPLIHSTSAGIEYEWEKSHPDLDDWDFYFNLGRNLDGEIVRTIVTNLFSVFEVSLVYLGADEFAKRLSRGELKTKESFKQYFNLMQSQILQIEDNMKLTKLQADALGIKPLEQTKLGLDKSDSVEVDQTFLDTLVASTTVLQSEKKQLEAKLQESEKLATLGREYENSVRDEALKNYRALALESQDEKMIELIGSASLEHVQSLNKEYLKRLEALHPVKDGTRASSVDPETEPANSNSELDDYKVR